MAAVHALVAEVTTDLIHTFETSYDETLEIKLGSDTEIEVDVERIVVGDERTSTGTTGNLLEDWCLDLGVTSLVEHLTHGTDDGGTLLEHVLHALVDNQVEVALTIAQLGVVEAIVGHTILILDDRQGTDALAEHGETLAMYGDFASLGTENVTLDTYEVADVEQTLEDSVVHHRIVGIGTQGIAAHIDLDAALGVLKLHEGSLAHDTTAHDATCHRDTTRIVGIGRGGHFDALVFQHLGQIDKILTYLVGIAGNHVLGCRIGFDT